MRFMAWLSAWLAVCFWLGTCIQLLDLLSGRLLTLSKIVFLLPPLAGVSLWVAGVIYLLNLPFMILAFRCPLYRRRLYKMLRLEEDKDETVPERVDQFLGEH